MGVWLGTSCIRSGWHPIQSNFFYVSMFRSPSHWPPSHPLFPLHLHFVYATSTKSPPEKDFAFWRQPPATCNAGNGCVSVDYPDFFLLFMYLSSCLTFNSQALAFRVALLCHLDSWILFFCSFFQVIDTADSFHDIFLYYCLFVLSVVS